MLLQTEGQCNAHFVLVIFIQMIIYPRHKIRHSSINSVFSNFITPVSPRNNACEHPAVIISPRCDTFVDGQRSSRISVSGVNTSAQNMLLDTRYVGCDLLHVVWSTMGKLTLRNLVRSFFFFPFLPHPVTTPIAPGLMRWFVGWGRQIGVTYLV